MIVTIIGYSVPVCSNDTNYLTTGFSDDAVVRQQMSQAGSSDVDRGCCVLKTAKQKCVFTNRAYCEHKAKEARVEFEFYTGTTCKELPACK
jgi:hypothetical protein